MIPTVPARKVTVYINEDAKYHHGSLYEAILELLRRKHVAGVTASRGIAGFGSGGILHTQRTESLAEHLPIRIEFIDTSDAIEALLPELRDMVGDGIIEVQDTMIVRVARTRPACGSDRSMAGL